MRWIIATACLIVRGDRRRAGPAGAGRHAARRRAAIAILYIGVAIAWGFVGVGDVRWCRRPENHTGALMVLVGLLVALTGLQFFDTPAGVRDRRAVRHGCPLGARAPAERVPERTPQGRAARRVVVCGYVAGALQLPVLLVTPCDDDCPADNPWLVQRQRRRSKHCFGGAAAVLGLIAIVGTIVLVLRRRQASSPPSAAAWSRCCCSAR